MQPHYRRLFIGIPVSGPLAKRLEREVAGLPEIATLPVRKENYHLLLHQFGFLLEEDIFPISEKLREALLGMEAFDVHFDAIDLFESSENPKEVRLLGKESEELLHLKSVINHLFTNKTHELRSFRPHITLVKLKKNKWLNLPKVPSVSKTVNLVESVSQVALYESLVIDGKRSYEMIDTFALQ